MFLDPDIYYFFSSHSTLSKIAWCHGDAGSGAGTGGGTGGSIRDAGGSLGKRAVAQEEQYFRKQVSCRKFEEQNAICLLSPVRNFNLRNFRRQSSV